MRYPSTKIFIITSIVLAVLQTTAVAARSNVNADGVDLRTRKLNGPRMGVTYVAQGDFLGRNGELSEALEANDVGVMISQFGWHFEWLVTPEGGGPSFVTQIIPFLGGVEYATVIPSVTLALGIRLPNGFELGLGPNLLVRIKGRSPVSSALVMAVGKSIDFSGVSIPLNVAITTNNSGTRFSFIFGYAMGSRKK